MSAKFRVSRPRSVVTEPNLCVPGRVRIRLVHDACPVGLAGDATWWTSRLSAGGFRCFPVRPVVCPIALGGNASPTSLLPVVAGRSRSIACHSRRINVSWPYSRWRICCRVRAVLCVHRTAHRRGNSPDRAAPRWKSIVIPCRCGRASRRVWCVSGVGPSHVQ